MNIRRVCLAKTLFGATKTCLEREKNVLWWIL